MAEKDSHPPVTSYIGNAIGVAKTLDAYGLDGSATLAELGIDVAATPSFDARVPGRVMHEALMRHADGALDPLFGLKFASFVNPMTYHAFGVMLTSATTLRAFCLRLQRYCAYINTRDAVRFDGHGRLSYHLVSPEEFRHQPLDALLHESAWAATMLKMVRSVSVPDFAPDKVAFSFSEPEGYTAEFDRYFRCPIEYDAEATALWFAEPDLDTPLPGGNAEMARHSEVLVYNYLKTFVEMAIANSARISLFELLPRGDFSLGSLAQSLGMPEQELTAQLKQAGTTYQQLLGDTRRELADEYIQRSDLTVNEIAYMLGFSDCSNFARSFRRWNGMSPSDFRDQLHKTG